MKIFNILLQKAVRDNSSLRIVLKCKIIIILIRFIVLHVKKSPYCLKFYNVKAELGKAGNFMFYVLLITLATQTQLGAYLLLTNICKWLKRDCMMRLFTVYLFSKTHQMNG